MYISIVATRTSSNGIMNELELIKAASAYDNLKNN
jgi:hypothetical protein